MNDKQDTDRHTDKQMDGNLRLVEYFRFGIKHMHGLYCCSRLFSVVLGRTYIICNLIIYIQITEQDSYSHKECFVIRLQFTSHNVITIIVILVAPINTTASRSIVG